MRNAAATTMLMAAAVAVAAQAPAQKVVPAPIQASDLTLRLEPAGSMPAGRNATSPVAAGSTLLLIDQGGELFRWTGTEAVRLLGGTDIPPAPRLTAHERILNAAADPTGATVYVMFVSSAAPGAIPRRMSPRDPDAWYVLCQYAFDGTRLTAPKPITAMQVRTEGHTGGGLAVLPDGSVLFAAGDNGDSYEDGWAYSQDPTVHLAKLLRIDPADGAVTVVAVGVRAAQRLVVSGAGDGARVSFVDPGGWVAEELNSVPVQDLSAGRALLNFGWGRAAGARSREGTFFVDQLGNSISPIPSNDGGYRAPVASFGREKAAAVAISGPVVGGPSFNRISALFGDLVTGAVYGITAPLTEQAQPVHRVALIDKAGEAVSLLALAGGKRPDPRFFHFPDGSAGVLLEPTGEFYRLTEVVK